MDEVGKLVSDLGITDPIVAAIVIILGGMLYYWLRGLKNKNQEKKYVDDVKRIVKAQKKAGKDLNSAKESVDDWAKRERVRGK